MKRLDDHAVGRLVRRLAERPPGEFHFPEIYGAGWDDLYVGDKVRLGRDFLTMVRAGRLPGVEDTGRKRAGGRIYRWRGR
ncbi:DUF1413 domain-containing protein [Acuticoccus mangrovi]|uniref:DUF1413 domain-containing protein n=1 Tax=Acuticoccus mangrovi TaxID=2796142 RepID=A0A934IP69_9HYPH|nr:DUF1413 domain-containing protein [Acuticoccus mangrovi]